MDWTGGVGATTIGYGARDREVMVLWLGHLGTV